MTQERYSRLPVHQGPVGVERIPSACARALGGLGDWSLTSRGCNAGKVGSRPLTFLPLFTPSSPSSVGLAIRNLLRALGAGP